MSRIYFKRLIWLGNVELIQRVLLTGKEIVYRIILITYKDKKVRELKYVIYAYYVLVIIS